MSLATVGLALIFLAGEPPEPEEKALAYLSREVPRWSVENRCFSCHNNGDAARALFKAIQMGRSIKPEATLDTERWLLRPEGWDRNGGDGPFSDKLLARRPGRLATPCGSPILSDFDPGSTGPMRGSAASRSRP
jgi:hypothetical protein